MIITGRLKNMSVKPFFRRKNERKANVFKHGGNAKRGAMRLIITERRKTHANFYQKTGYRQNIPPETQPPPLSLRELSGQGCARSRGVKQFFAAGFALAAALPRSGKDRCAGRLFPCGMFWTLFLRSYSDGKRKGSPASCRLFICGLFWESLQQRCFNQMGAQTVTTSGCAVHK